MKRWFDLILGFVATVFLLLPTLLIALLVRLTSPGPILYWSDRVGQRNRIFKMPQSRAPDRGFPTLKLRNGPKLSGLVLVTGTVGLREMLG